jgi:hypothetical protein
MAAMSAKRVLGLYRHPVKGFTPESLDRVALSAGSCFPGDRLYAVENGPSGFDRAAPTHLPKIKFLQLMRHERLARLTTRYRDATRLFTIERDGRLLVAGDLGRTAGRAAVEAFLEREFADEARGPLRVVEAPDGHRFMDSRRGFVSLVNAASLRALEALLGKPIDARRFRPNIVADLGRAWAEFDLVGRRVRIGGALFEALARIDRCAATDVDPTHGVRDGRIVQSLEAAYGHHDCGVYLSVVSAGALALGDSVSDLGAGPPQEAGRSDLPF